MKLGSLERLEVSGVCSAVHNVLEQRVFWFEGLENISWFPCFLFLCVCPLCLLYMLETLTNDDQK